MHSSLVDICSGDFFVESSFLDICRMGVSFYSHRLWISAEFLCAVILRRYL